MIVQRVVHSALVTVGHVLENVRVNDSLPISGVGVVDNDDLRYVSLFATTRAQCKTRVRAYDRCGHELFSYSVPLPIEFYSVTNVPPNRRFP